MTSIIRIGRDGAGAAGLEKCSVVPPEAVISGAANEQGEVHFETADGSLVIGTWESTPYAEILSYPDSTEYCTVVSGKLAITGPDGKIETFGPGESYVLTAGFEGRFEVLETMRKIYVLHTPKA